jgi:ABC-type lipopolysaccharide export system ATPase subunit
MDKHKLIVDSVVVRFGQKTVLSGGYITSETGMVTGLLSDAPFYILDEPFTQVDPVNIEEVKALIWERSQDHGIIVTDHNYDAISSVADNLFVIADGYTSPVRSREDLVRHGYLRD